MKLYVLVMVLKTKQMVSNNQTLAVAILVVLLFVNNPMEDGRLKALLVLFTLTVNITQAIHLSTNI